MKRSISIAAIDVGFDIRLHDIATALDRDIGSVKYDTATGKTTTVSGDILHIAETLIRNGYKIYLGKEEIT